MEKKFRKTGNRMFLPDLLDGEGDIIPIIADGEEQGTGRYDVPESVSGSVIAEYRAFFPGVVLPFP
jgi:hypothetical protein